MPEATKYRDYMYLLHPNVPDKLIRTTMLRVNDSTRFLAEQSATGRGAALSSYEYTLV